MLILVLKNNILLSMLKTLPLLSGFFMNKMSNYISKKKNVTMYNICSHYLSI